MHFSEGSNFRYREILRLYVVEMGTCCTHHGAKGGGYEGYGIPQEKALGGGGGANYRSPSHPILITTQYTHHRARPKIWNNLSN